MSKDLKKNQLMLKRLQKLEKNLRELQRAKVEVGILNGHQTYEDGTTVLEVAYNHEYGQTVPQRSFLNLTMDRHKADGSINKLASVVFEQVALKDKNPKAELNKAGVVLVSWVKATIDRKGYGEWPALNYWTEIEKERKNSPLVDTQLLYDSIDYRILGI